MLYIEKNAPPQAYLNSVAKIKGSPIWRSIQDGDTAAIREQFDLLPKQEIRKGLLEEQHCLCAYCMKRISNNDDNSEAVHMNIEHRVPLSQDKEHALDYKNFLGVCEGGKDVDGSKNRILCCDASKGDTANLTVDPLDKDMMQYIAYKSDGTIYCLSTAGPLLIEKIERDLNEVLQLNGRKGQDTATRLVKGRRDAYKIAKSMYENLSKRKQLTSDGIGKIIREIKKLDRYPEFAGTMLFVLEGKRKHLISQGK